MTDAKKYASRLVKGSAIVFVSLIASQLVAFLLRVFLARSLTVAEYGLFYAVFTFVSFVGFFPDLGFGNALVKYIPEFSVKKQFGRLKSSIAFTLFLSAILSLFIVAILFLLSGQIASGFFKTETAVPIIQILAVWFFVMIFLLFLSVFRGFQDMPMYALLQFLRNFLDLILVVVIVGYFGFGVTGVALAYLIELSAIAVLAFVILKSKYSFIFKAKMSITRPLVKKLSFFAFPVFLGGLGSLVITYMSTLMITGLRSLSEVGFYQAALSVSNFLWYLPTALVTVFFPMVSEFWARREKKLLSGALHLLVKFSFIVIIPAVLIFIAFPEVVINLLFGPAYRASATALQILSATAIAYTLFMILSYTMQGIGKPIVSTKVVAVIAVCNLVGNAILIPPYGIEGAAIVTFVSYLLGMGLLFYYSKEFMKFTALSSSLLKTACGGLLTLLLILGLKSMIKLNPLPETFVVMIPSLVFYGVWILVTKAVTRDDLMLVARIVPMPRWLVRAARKLVGR